MCDTDTDTATIGHSHGSIRHHYTYRTGIVVATIIMILAGCAIVSVAVIHTCSTNVTAAPTNVSLIVQWETIEFCILIAVHSCQRHRHGGRTSDESKRMCGWLAAAAADGNSCFRFDSVVNRWCWRLMMLLLSILSLRKTIQYVKVRQSYRGSIITLHRERKQWKVRVSSPYAPSQKHTSAHHK